MKKLFILILIVSSVAVSQWRDSARTIIPTPQGKSVKITQFAIGDTSWKTNGGIAIKNGYMYYSDGVTWIRIASMVAGSSYDTNRIAYVDKRNVFTKSNLFEPDSGTTTEPVVYIRSYDSIGSAGSAFDISARKGSSTPLVVHLYSNKARAAIQADNTVPVGDGYTVGILRLRNAQNNTLGDFGRQGWKNFLRFDTDSLGLTVFTVDPKGAIHQGDFEYGVGLHEMVNVVMLPYLSLYTNSRRQTVFRIDSSGYLNTKYVYPLDDSASYLGLAGSRYLQVHGINGYFRKNMMIGSSLIDGGEIALTAFGQDSASSLTSTATGILRLGNTGTTVSLYSGIYTVPSLKYGWLQVRRSDLNSWYDLVLNPNGGNVVINNAGALSNMATLQIKNLTNKNATVWYNSRNDSINWIDSSGAINAKSLSTFDSAKVNGKLKFGGNLTANVPIQPSIIFWDSVQHTFYGDQFIVRRSFDMTHGVITADRVDSNSTAETFLDSASMGASYPNTGKVVNLNMYGIHTIANPQTMIIRIRHGSLTGTVIDSVIITTAITDKGFDCESICTFRSVGATGTIVARIKFVSNGVYFNSARLGTVTINTTGRNTLFTTAQFSANGNNKIRVRQGWVETKN